MRALLFVVGVTLPVIGLARPASVLAQEGFSADTLRLGVLQDAAVERDPRARQFGILAEQTSLRLRSLDAERMPSLSIQGLAQYQSDVASIPFELPGGVMPPGPAKDSYDAHLAVGQTLHDPTRRARREVERARLAESQARVRSSLFPLRERVNEAFFAALSLQAGGEVLEAGMTELEERLRVASERVTAGAALPSEAALLEAELLRREQALAELEANRAAARLLLAELTGYAMDEGAILLVPDLSEEVRQARAGDFATPGRPEVEQFARTRNALERQRAVLESGELPRVAAFGRLGYGRPGLNPLGGTFDSYWVGGVRVEWTPWSWGSTEREAEVLTLQQETIASEQAAFEEMVRRSAATELLAVDRLEAAIARDDEIIRLREEILSETGLRLAEGVVTSAEYVERESELIAAQLERATRRVELAAAQARYLTLLGKEIP